MLATLLLSATLAADPTFHFDTRVIASDLTIGYAVHLCDLNGDGKPDIVVVDKERVVWYENPTWKVRTILTGKTKPDNVCLASLDIDGDGQLDLVLGAAWKPFDTNTPGTLDWLKRGKTLDDEWSRHSIACDEPTVHRVQVIDKRIILMPLMGRGSSAKNNWTDGRPVRILDYEIPQDPMKPDNWKPRVLNESLHVIHNFAFHSTIMYLANYDGIHALDSQGRLTKLNAANQTNPKSNRGASEIAVVTSPRDKTSVWIGTVEPWHGNQIVVYPKPDQRIVVDEHLRWGHGIKWADLDGDGIPELIAGVRDNPDPKADKHSEKRGIRIYQTTKESNGQSWTRILLDPDGVAVEDLAVGDLNGDGKPDIVAVGRATKNAKIYLQTK
jgi:hypothetical protein